ncbi:GntR family transcriptional regulator [Nitrincola sp. MINF-07-Sa-05]|uniref:GntR family transcriptional regulator n=1 Tax=Nitrincola salilacus TaxID=3400273 RepID=UPI0039182FF9
MSESGPKETLIEVAIDRLSADIVSGELPPDHKLQIAELKTRYQIGASPLREALAKLSSLGFVVFDSRRGFRVAAISREDLVDITRVRKIIEIEALRSSIAAGDDEWEVGVVAAIARLRLIGARSREGTPPSLEEVERAHRQFHLALLGGCHSPRLTSFQQMLYDQAQRYRKVMLSHWDDLDDFVAKHVQLAETILGRDCEEACTALAQHIELTLSHVYPDANGKR